MNSEPNSDCKQCTESKLGWVHSAHIQNPGRAHTSRALPRSWVMLRAQQAGRARSQRRSRAQPVQVARSACACHAHARCTLVATRPGSLPQVATSKLQVATSNFNRPGRDLKLMSRPASALPTKTPLSQNLGRDTKPPQGSQNHVATSNQCRDTTQVTPGRDLQMGPRHRFSCPAPKPGRDFIFFPGRDLLELHLCRDIVSMSRPRSCP